MIFLQRQKAHTQIQIRKQTPVVENTNMSSSQDHLETEISRRANPRMGLSPLTPEDETINTSQKCKNNQSQIITDITPRQKWL